MEQFAPFKFDESYPSNPSDPPFCRRPHARSSFYVFDITSGQRSRPLHGGCFPGTMPRDGAYQFFAGWLKTPLIEEGSRSAAGADFATGSSALSRVKFGYDIPEQHHLV